MEEPNNKFEGWAVIELFGHSRESGYVTTEYFGSGALFRVDVPELAEREETLTRPQWIDGQLAEIGSKIKRTGKAGRTRFIGPSAIYAMNPCSKDAAIRALEAMTPRDVQVIELVERKRLSGELPGEFEYEDDTDQDTADVG